MRLHAIGFGSLNLDEFWEVTSDFLRSLGLRSGEEYVRDVDWFQTVYPSLTEWAVRRAADPGGSAANTIAALCRMGFDTGFYGVTGENDREGLRLGELGQPENLRVRTTAVPAGRCLALVEGTHENRDRTLVILPNANDLAGSELPDQDYFHQAEWVHMTSFVSRHVLDAQIWIAETMSPATRVSFDPGEIYCAFGIETLAPILRRSDILFVTTREMEMLTSDASMERAAATLLALGVGTVVVKLGAEGLAAFRCDRSAAQPAVAPKAIRDRTGAGDVAAAGFLAGILKSLDLGQCLRLAALCASRSIEGYGRSTYPDREFLDTCLSR